MARSLADFIRYAEKVGMPVKILKFLNEHYKVGSTKQDLSYTNVDSNTVHYSEGVRDTIASAVIGLESDGSITLEKNAINELYHEASHAYIDVKRGPAGGEGILGTIFNDYAYLEKRLESQYVKKIFDGAQRYYKGAPLGNSLPALVDDEERVAVEAIGMYVGHRAAWLWTALDTLTAMHQGLQRNPKTAQKVMRDLSKLQLEYDDAMASRTFGYQDVWGRGQVEVRKAISGALRRFCDEFLLEGKVPDKFHQSPALSKLHVGLISKSLLVRAATEAHT